MEWHITTFDNPWNPLTHPREWDAYDTTMGYCTLSTLARITSTSLLFSDELNEKLIEDSMLSLIQTNPFLWTKIYENQKPFAINLKEIVECLNT